MASEIKLAVVHDHAVMREGVVKVVQSLGYDICFQCGTQKNLNALISLTQPDIVLIVVDIRTIDDFALVQSIVFHHPNLPVVAMSMQDDDTAIVRLIKKGVKGYILKDSSLEELQRVIQNVGAKGFSYSEPDFSRLMKYIHQYNLRKHTSDGVVLSDREVAFLKNLATELTYKQIADKMCVSTRTVDGYRNTICKRLNLKTRIGLVLYAVRKGLIDIKAYSLLDL